MSTAKQFATIQHNRDQIFPRLALTHLIAHPEESIPLLLDLLTDVTENFDDYYEKDSFIGHLYAFFLLAQFREKRAYPLIAQFFIRHGDRADEICGDFVTENLARVLACVFDGDLTLIKQLIENSQVNEWVRGASVRSLTILVLHDMLPRDEVIAYFRELFTAKLERTHGQVWNNLAVETVQLYPKELQNEINQAYAEGFVDTNVMRQAEVKATLAIKWQVHLAQLLKNRHYTRVTDTIAEMEGWACFQPLPSRQKRKTAQPLTKKVGRNEPCPCGSGKKYKQCCWPN